MACQVWHGVGHHLFLLRCLENRPGVPLDRFWTGVDISIVGAEEELEADDVVQIVVLLLDLCIGAVFGDRQPVCGSPLRIAGGLGGWTN